MTASSFTLGTAENRLRRGELVTAADLMDQFFLWEIIKHFGPDSDAKITEVLTKLDLEHASTHTRYGWVHTDDGEMVIYRADEKPRSIPLVQQ